MKVVATLSLIFLLAPLATACSSRGSFDELPSDKVKREKADQENEMYRKRFDVSQAIVTAARVLAVGDWRATNLPDGHNVVLTISKDFSANIHVSVINRPSESNPKPESPSCDLSATGSFLNYEALFDLQNDLRISNIPSSSLNPGAVSASSQLQCLVILLFIITDSKFRLDLETRQFSHETSYGEKFVFSKQ